MTTPTGESESLVEELAALREALHEVAQCDFTEVVAELRDTRCAIDALTDELTRLTTTVEGLAIDIKTAPGEAAPPERQSNVLTSFPLDPLADDWQINRVRPEELPDDAAVRSPTDQQQLF